MGIGQFITCYNLSCFILASKGPKIQRIFVVTAQYRDMLFLQTNLSECLVFTETLGRWLPISVLSAFNHSRDNKKTLINKLEHVLGVLHSFVSFSWTVQTLPFSLSFSYLLIMVSIRQFLCLSYWNSKNVGDLFILVPQL